MKKSKRLLSRGLLVTAFVWTATAWGGATLQDGVLTFDVAEGSETYDGTIDADVTAVVKTGEGKMTVRGSSPNFTGKTVSVEGGLLEIQRKDSLGKGNTVTVQKDAQLVLSMEVVEGENMLCVGGLNDLVIAGDGPDGNGAVYKNTTTTAGNAAAFFGNIRLSADASIYVHDRSGVSSGFGRTVDMGGHALTIKGDGAMFCGYGYNRQENTCIWKNGTLILDGPQVMFEGNPVFEGGAENKIVMRAKNRHKFYDFAPKIKWTLVVENYMVFEATRSWLDGKWNADANTWAGPAVIRAAGSTLDIVGSSYSSYGTSRQAFTFAGSVSVENGCSGVVVYQGSPALLRLGGAFTGGQVSPHAGQVVRAIADGAFPSGADAYYSGSVFEVQPGEGYCSDAGAAAMLANLRTTQGARASAGKAAVYTEGDTTFSAPITMQTYKLGLKHTGTGTLTFADNLTANVDGVIGIWWLNDEPNRTVFKGSATDIALMDVTAGTVEVAEGARVFMSAGGGSEFAIGGSNVTSQAELKIAGGCLDMALPAAGQPTGYILLGDRGTKPGLLTITGGALTNSVFGASNCAWDKAAILQSGGEFLNYMSKNQRDKGYSPMLALRGKGFYGLSGGTYRVNGHDWLAGTTGSYAAFRQTGGRIETDTGAYFMNMSLGGVSEFTMTGGEVVNENEGGYMRLADGATGGAATLTLCGDGDPQVRIKGWVNMGNATKDFASAINLNAGTFECCRIYVQDQSSREGTSSAYVNFNGGRMRASASAANYFGHPSHQPPTAITIYPKGATFDTPAGFKNYFSGHEKNADGIMVVRSATGRGVARIRLPEGMPRTGYTGVLPVRISGGGHGEGATAAMAFDPATGSVGDELIVTCPGVNYTEAPTVTVFGPDWNTEYVCDVELTEGDQDPGVIYKTGEGMMGFNCVNNTFAGTVVVSNGTFYVPRASVIDQRIKVKCAGGTFEYDWTSRTIAELGGWGAVKGSPNDTAAHSLTVTDALRFDAEDALAGRTLAMEDGAAEEIRDRIVLGRDAVVRIDNAEKLAGLDGRCVLLRTSYPLNRAPELEGELPKDWKVALSPDGLRLRLFKTHGMTLIVR